MGNTKDRYYTIGNDGKYLIQTHGVKLSEVHGVDKGINPDIKPERQVLKSPKSANKPKLEQGREGLR